MFDYLNSCLKSIRRTFLAQFRYCAVYTMYSTLKKWRHQALEQLSFTMGSELRDSFMTGSKHRTGSGPYQSGDGLVKDGFWPLHDGSWPIRGPVRTCRLCSSSIQSLPWWVLNLFRTDSVRCSMGSAPIQDPFRANSGPIQDQFRSSNGTLLQQKMITRV